MTTALTLHHAARKARSMLAGGGSPLDENADWRSPLAGAISRQTTAPLSPALPQAERRAVFASSPRTMLAGAAPEAAARDPARGTRCSSSKSTAGRSSPHGSTVRSPSPDAFSSAAKTGRIHKARSVELPEKCDDPVAGGTYETRRRSDQSIKKSCSPSGERATRLLCANSARRCQPRSFCAGRYSRPRALSCEAEAPEILGAEHTLYASPRIDNLANAYAATCAIRDCQPTDHIAVFISYQHEEIGSHTRQGAAASLLSQTLARIAEATDTDPRARCLQRASSSAATRPTPRIRIIQRKPTLCCVHVSAKGLCSSSPPATATPPRRAAKPCCAPSVPKKHPAATFVNRADMRGGSTIGPIAETACGIEAIDVGNPMLAMHSIRELADLPRSGRHGTIDGRIFSHR